MSGFDPDRTAVARNDDVRWDDWPVLDYLAENYRQVHPSDAAVIEHHSAFYRGIGRDSLARSVEFGAGPNLYPLMLAAGCSRWIDAIDPSAANIGYLARQIENGPDHSWLAFYQRCRAGNPALPDTLAEALARVHVAVLDGREVPADSYDLASMHFVAEAATEDPGEFAAFCRAFIRCVHPGGHLVAAFMENLGRYRLGSGPVWPHLRVDSEVIERTFAQEGARQIELSRIDSDPTLPDYGYTGMVLLTAWRAGTA